MIKAATIRRRDLDAGGLRRANNAGLALGKDPAQPAKLSDWDTMVATDVTGLLHVARALLSGMAACDRGHVVNLGSVAATYP